MPSLKSILSLSLSLLSLLQYHTNALALPTNEHDTTTISKREMNITLICPSTRAPVFGSVSGAWKILEHLKTLDNEPPLPTVAMEDGCRRMGCQEGTGVFWCVRDVSNFSAVVRFLFPVLLAFPASFRCLESYFQKIYLNF